MMGQLVQVLRTYATRPLNWLIGLGIFVCLVVIFASVNYTKKSRVAPDLPRPLPREWVELSRREPERRHSDFWEISDLIAQGKAKNVRSLELMLDGSKPLPDLSPFENLEYARLSGDFTNEDIGVLAAVKNLAGLSLSSVDELPSHALAGLEGQLQFLEITTEQLLQQSEQLPELTKLQHLELDGSNLDSEVLDAVLSIPNLRILVFESSSILLTKDELLLFKDHGNLKEIYAHWNQYFSRNDFDESLLGPVRALPMSYPTNRLWAFKMAQLAMCFVATLIGGHVFAQFVAPYSRVVPKFASAHQLGVMIVFLAVAVPMLVGQLRLGTAALPAISLIFWIPACLTITSQFVWSPRPVLVTMIVMPVILIMIAPLAFSDLLLEYSPADYLSFVEGKMPEVALGIIVVEAISLGIAILLLPKLAPVVNERLPSLPAQGFSMSQGWSKPNADQPFFKLFDKSLKHLEFHEDSWWKMIRLWRVGTPYRPLTFLAAFVPFMMLFMCFGFVMQLYRYQSLEAFAFEMLIPITATQVIGMGLILPSVTWGMRKKYLEMELLRPLDRKTFVNQLFAAFAVDHWVGWLGIACGMVFVVVKPLNGNASTSFPFVLAMLAAAVWLFSAGTTVFAFKETWLAAVIVGTQVFLLIGLTSGLAVAMDELGFSDEAGLRVLTGLSVVVIVLGLLILGWMYRRTLRREWA